MLLKFFFLILAVFILCKATSIQNLSNYNYPQPLSTDSFERIAVLATNDIHGHLIPDINSIPNSENYYRTGGTTILSSYIQALKKEWKENLIWLDAGDQYQGTMESNLFAGEPIVKFINYMNLTHKTTTAIGNHDFDFGYKNMTKSFSEAYFPYVSANILNRTTNSFWNFPNTYPDHIIEVGNLKIGVIGLSTIFTPQTTANDVSDLIFEDYVNITIEESQKLRSKGADIVLLTCHVGTYCEIGDLEDALYLTMRTKFTPQKSTCVTTEELNKFLTKIPSNTLDAVIGGHLHTIVHHWINDIPVVLGDCNARHFNVLYLTYDKLNKKVLSNLTEMEGPVPVCENLIDNTNSCYINQSVVNLSQAKFSNFTYHNEPIQEDLVLRDLMKLYIETAEKYREIVLAYVESDMKIEAYEESALGDFISDAVAKATNTNLGLINRGMLRINWPLGNLTYYQLYETIPFDDDVSTFEITGEEIWKVMSFLQNGSMAFYPSSGFKQYICNSNKKLVNITFINDEPIDLQKTYLMSANNFLLHGGDDFAQVLNFYKPRNIKTFGSIRDAVASLAQEMSPLNSPQNPIIDKNKPRIVIIDDCVTEITDLKGEMLEESKFLKK